MPGSLHSTLCALLGATHSSGVPHRADTLVFCSQIFFFIHLHHLRLPLHQTGMYRAGSAGSGQATSPPSAWPGGDSAAERSSAWPRERPPPSHSSPATPGAASLAAPRYLALRGTRREGKGMRQIRGLAATTSERPTAGMINQRAGATKYFDMVSTLINFMFKTLRLNRKKISTWKFTDKPRGKNSLVISSFDITAKSKCYPINWFWQRKD